MARATVIGLTRFRYHDPDGTLRSARMGETRDVPCRAEYDQAVRKGYIEPEPGAPLVFAEASRDAAAIALKRKPPRDWKRRPSLWFVTPVWKRVALTRICLEERVWVCGELSAMGIDASCVVIGDDENLQTAEELGFAVCEHPNAGLGAKYNAGIRWAAENGVDYVCMIGSETWVLPSYFADLPRGAQMNASQRLANFSPDGKTLHDCRATYEGAHCRTYPTALFSALDYRPASPQIMRGCDDSILKAVKQKTPIEIRYQDADELQLIGFRSDTQVTSTDEYIQRYGVGTIARPWAKLKTRYPEELVERARAFYAGQRKVSPPLKGRRGRTAPAPKDDRRVLAGMASIPERVESLERVVAGLAPQVDRLVISLNGYEKAPDFLSRYPNVEATLRDDGGGDTEKFAAVDDWTGYVLTVDDDILYPPDYVGTVLAGIERFNRERVVSFHGGTTLGWNGAAVAATHKRVRCLGDLEQDDLDVNVVGTGVMGYHASRIPVWRGAFRYANMADVQMACHARLFGVPMVCLAHKAGWLTDICPRDGRRIYASNRLRDGTRCDTHRQREIEIQRFDWKAAPPGRPTVRVSIATCGRPEKLRLLLDDLVTEAGWVDIELSVYEDPADGTDYSDAQALCKRQGWKWHRFESRLGRRGFWQLVDRELRDTRKSKADWFLFLPDDVRLIRHTIPKAITLWQRLEDPATLTLWRLKSLEGRPNWTGKTPVPNGIATEIFHVDGLYLCQREALETLGFACARPEHNYTSGSGVGSLLSKALDGAGKRMYRVDSSLVTVNDDGVSIMNPSERLRHPAVAL